MAQALHPRALPGEDDAVWKGRVERESGVDPGGGPELETVGDGSGPFDRFEHPAEPLAQSSPLSRRGDWLGVEGGGPVWTHPRDRRGRIGIRQGRIWGIGEDGISNETGETCR